MTDSDFHNIEQIDCESENLFPASPAYNLKIKEMIKNKQFDRLRLKTKYFTKEYDNKSRLLSVEPFFIDVRLSVVPEDAEFVESYDLRTGAKVNIYLDPKGTHYIYSLLIPELNLKFDDLFRMYELVEKFKKEGELLDSYVKRWYQDYGILEHLLFDDKILEININRSHPFFHEGFRNEFIPSSRVTL